jgi:5-hydroxyisourate hydrolase-like protein (transthyretin family)
VEYLVFAYQNKGEDQLLTSKCSRTHALGDPVHDSDLEWMRNLAKASSGGSIFGHVMLAQEGPMRGAKLNLRGGAVRDITPDEQGAYELKNLPAGEYKVTATVPSGYLSGPERTIVIHDKGCAEVNWSFSYDGYVRGRVADLDGTPVTHLMVELERKDPNSFNGLATVDIKETGEDGRYDFSGVNPGNYIVVANNFGTSSTMPYPRVYYPASRSLEGSLPVRVGASASVDDVDVVMPRAWKKVTVTAKVQKEDGTPAPGAEVDGYEVKDPTSITPMSAVTGEDGLVTLSVYDGQEYYLTALVQGGTQQRCGGPLKFTAHDGLNLGVVRIEHPWGNCLAQLDPNFHR